MELYPTSVAVFPLRSWLHGVGFDIFTLYQDDA